MNTTLSSDILVARVDCDGDDKWAGSFCTEQGVTKFPSVKLGMPFEQLETLDISKPESIYKPLDQRNISDGIMYTVVSGDGARSIQRDPARPNAVSN
jgi:hypothetical protein